MRKNKFFIKYILLCTVSIVSLLCACNKDPKQFSAPYESGIAPLDVELNPTNKLMPEEGAAGIETVLKVKGLDRYKDKVVFRFNGQVAQIVEITADQIKVKVPPFASTGVTSITIDDIIFFGPIFKVDGFVDLDPTFQVGVGTNGTVFNSLSLEDGRVIYVGDFTNYNRKGTVRPINRIVRTYMDGTYDASFRTGKGANGGLASVLRIGNNYFVGGSFSGYDQRGDNINNMTSLLLTGSIDTMGIRPFRRPDQKDTLKYYPRFNGGFNSAVSQMYDAGGKIIASGNFRYYISRRYDKPNKLETRDSVILDSVEIRHIARLNLDGSLDKSYRFKPDGTPFVGANGYVNTMRHQEGTMAGKIIVFGTFTSFDGQKVGNITRLNPDGTIDPTFNPDAAGADYTIYEVTYNSVTDKYIVVGDFNNFNGISTPRMVVLNANGSVYQGFKPFVFEGGNPNFAQQLKDGLIVVSGSFLRYNGIVRSGFMILNPDGSLHPNYNNTGLFDGSIYKIVETETEDRKRALLIMGRIRLFNNEQVGNLIRIKL
ncbi:DUF5008 domain-containing protein [Sphingobacterium sp. Mn56C]|uniref:DUF5008 domain-containing protein n=1 Tax=Sphingobacterium sp. Mn56C TaxID=3395261 RepID=UPI003BD370F1